MHNSASPHGQPPHRIYERVGPADALIQAWAKDRKPRQGDTHFTNVAGKLDLLVIADAAIIRDACALFALRKLVPHADGSQSLVLLVTRASRIRYHAACEVIRSVTSELEAYNHLF